MLLCKISFYNFKEATVTFNKHVLEGSFLPSHISFSTVVSKPRYRCFCKMVAIDLVKITSFSFLGITAGGFKNFMNH